MNGPLVRSLSVYADERSSLVCQLTEFRIRLACNALIECVMQFVLDWIRIYYPLCMLKESDEIEKKLQQISACS